VQNVGEKRGFDLSNVKDLEEIHRLLTDDGVKHCCKKYKHFLCLQQSEIMCPNCMKTSETPDSKED
jgi:hypothetical protein